MEQATFQELLEWASDRLRILRLKHCSGVSVEECIEVILITLSDLEELVLLVGEEEGELEEDQSDYLACLPALRSLKVSEGCLASDSLVHASFALADVSLFGKVLEVEALIMSLALLEVSQPTSISLVQSKYNSQERYYIEVCSRSCHSALSSSSMHCGQAICAKDPLLSVHFFDEHEDA